MDVWIGKKWCYQEKKILLLGESWWGPQIPMQLYIGSWCSGNPDPFFTRIFNSCSGLNASGSSQNQKLYFWDNYAFMNFVFWSVGSTNSSKATANDFKQAAIFLERYLRVLNPNSVWIIGKTHSAYSQPVLTKLGIHCVVSNHPSSPITNVQLKSDFSKL